MDNKKETGIWVFAESRGDALAECSLELLAKAAQLKAQSGEEVTAVLFGWQKKQLAQGLIAGGADRVIVEDAPVFASYKPRPYAEALTDLAKKYRPSVLLLSATSLGRDLAPRVMCSLKTGLTADCLDLELDDHGVLIQHKPSYGGNIMCTIVVEKRRPQMATVRPGVFTPLEPNPNAQGEILEENFVPEDDCDYEILERIPRVATRQPISQAKVIVACGRGVTDPAEFAMFEELAQLIGGQVGCSRPLVDEGLLPHECQIGQSGNTVKPKFILNVAISGAVQYLVGMQNAECILSVNRNENAEIFSASHYAAAADYKELIPAVIEEIKRRKQQ